MLSILNIVSLKISWLAEVDPRAPFSKATTPKCREGCKSFPLTAPLTFDPYFRMLNVKKASSTIFDGGARGVVVIVVGNGHGDTSSNPGRD